MYYIDILIFKYALYAFMHIKAFYYFNDKATKLIAHMPTNYNDYCLSRLLLTRVYTGFSIANCELFFGIYNIILLINLKCKITELYTALYKK